MRTQEEINKKIADVAAKLDESPSFKYREKIDILLNVLENDLDCDQIEEEYYDGHETDREQIATKARQWLDEEITDDEFTF